MVFGLSRKRVSPHFEVASEHGGRMGDRQRSDDSCQSQTLANHDFDDPTSHWVEHHATPALQQWQVLDDGGACSEKSCSSSPPAQLDQHMEEAWSCDRASPAGAEPLQGHDRYSKVADICRSVHSFVQLAVDGATGQQVAVKFLRRTTLDATAVSREVQHQRACAGHPHIVQLLDVFVTRLHLAIVLEYCNGGDLAGLVSKRLLRGERGMSEEEARHYFQQVVIAVDYCHCLGIALRDIKVDNMLLHWAPGAERPVVKLCDFGYSLGTADGGGDAACDTCDTACGTPEYMAPEVLCGAGHCARAADVWAAGVSLYVLLVGGFPFTRPGDDGQPPQRALQAMFLRIVAGRCAPAHHLSPGARHLLHTMLAPDLSDRITLDDLLAQPWFRRDLCPRLRAVNADLVCNPGSNSAVNPSAAAACRLGDGQLAQLVAAAAPGTRFRSRPDCGPWGRGGGGVC